ncbi:MAG: hypothetical protein A2176_05940 [Spirochaetes bacterium RBG_13_51_14]|nr:MAG: hypothetical protein A2176_05940 [Spirochaetes bacterium RBG_13_51_14]
MNTVEFIINGKMVRAVRDECIMKIARENGIPIDGLCYSPELESAGGSCRLCLVEVHEKGKMRVVTSCNYPVRDNIEVKTDTPFIKKIKRNIIELLMAKVPESEVIREIAAREGIEKSRYKHIEFDQPLNKCISCGLCTQVCAEIVGVSAISMINRSYEKTAHTPFKKESAVCIGCGACAYICPTHAIEMKDRDNTRVIWGREFVMQRCKECGIPYIPEAQVSWIVETTGKDRNFFEKCPDCR